MPRKKSLRYLDPSATITLHEGIRELRDAEGADGDAVENVAPELIPDLEIHDAIHVLFACGTDLTGEISAHIWTLFGTDLPIKEMHRVNMHQDHRQVLADIGHRKLLVRWLRNIPHLFATIWRSLRMTRKWPAKDYAQYLDTPLIELRDQFNIRLPAQRTGKQTRGSAGAAVRHASRRRLTAQQSA